MKNMGSGVGIISEQRPVNHRRLRISVSGVGYSVERGEIIARENNYHLKAASGKSMRRGRGPAQNPV
ncbi:MAG: hypothetical protein ABIL06_12855 [Pseudomonadota bacterium]